MLLQHHDRLPMLLQTTQVILDGPSRRLQPPPKHLNRRIHPHIRQLRQTRSPRPNSSCRRNASSKSAARFNATCAHLFNDKPAAAAVTRHLAQSLGGAATTCPRILPRTRYRPTRADSHRRCDPRKPDHVG